LRHYFSEFGFGRKTGIDLPDEESGILPDWKKWDKASWSRAPIGQYVAVTPIQMAVAYGAVANGGKLMKPYLIEAFETNGHVDKKFNPTVLNGSIMSKATADTLTRALKMVTLEGTATRLKNAKCTVAGKTGTARTVLSPDENPQKKDPYVSVDGKRKYQATFVGFFPADEPQYTAIVVVYTKPTIGSVYGGVIPAMTFREIVDNIWSLDSTWGDEYEARAKVPEMRQEYIATRQGSVIPVPDVKGMGLKDAIYAIENNGFKCVYEGIGHVAGQIPAAGQSRTKGETIKITLK
jgi:cell division protein FtsI (penicillin-binding protein 3)